MEVWKGLREDVGQDHGRGFVAIKVIKAQDDETRQALLAVSGTEYWGPEGCNIPSLGCLRHRWVRFDANRMPAKFYGLLPFSETYWVPKLTSARDFGQFGGHWLRTQPC